MLYELSWVELIDVIAGCFPEVELVVLSPRAARDGAAPVLHYLFGAGGFELASRTSGDTLVKNSRAEYEPAEIKEKTGLDQVACDLLVQRFRDELEDIAARSGVRVF